MRLDKYNNENDWQHKFITSTNQITQNNLPFFKLGSLPIEVPMISFNFSR